MGWQELPPDVRKKLKSDEPELFLMCSCPYKSLWGLPCWHSLLLIKKLQICHLFPKILQVP